jgi:hypothetical protein
MLELTGFDLNQFKDILEMVEYDIHLLKQEGGAFFGLHVILSNNKLKFLFASTNELFDNFIEPLEMLLDGSYNFKNGFLEYYIVYDLIRIFKEYDNDLKIVLNEELTELKVIKDNKVILDYTIN